MASARELSSFRRLSIVSTIATLVLVSIGGLVRATESGLGCGPDWPVCNGKIVPLFSHYTVVIEFSHRFVAGIVALLLGALMTVAWRKHRDRPRLVKASVAAFVLVLFQAGLGAVVVKLHLEAESVVLHLGTAMLLLGLLIYITVAAATAEGALGDREDAAVSKRAWAGAWSAFALLLVGSWVTGTEAGYVFSDWPLMAGAAVPDLAVEAEAVHFAHRFLAGVVGVLIVVLVLPVLRRRDDFPLAARLARAAVALYVLQVLVGALNIWTKFNASVTANSASVAIHLALAALIWASLVGVAVVTRPGLRAEVAARGARDRPEPALEVSG